MRTQITLACTECKERNYRSEKNKKNDPERMEIKKFCSQDLARKKAGVTQKDLAEKTGIYQADISKDIVIRLYTFNLFRL